MVYTEIGLPYICETRVTQGWREREDTPHLIPATEVRGDVQRLDGRRASGDGAQQGGERGKHDGGGVHVQVSEVKCTRGV